VLVDLSYRSQVNEAVQSDNGIFFVRDDARYGTELWATNAVGTSPQLVADLTPGEQGSRLESLTSVGDGVYFVNVTSENRRQLWWSDGAASDTRMVAENIVAIQRDYTEDGVITQLANNGSQVFFLDLGGPSFYSGLWAASNRGTVLENLTTKDSFIEAVSGDWEPRKIESFQETKSQPSVFILNASARSGDQRGVDRRFLGITDGTPEGTRISDFAVRSSSYLTEAVALSNVKVMFVERSNEGSRVLTIDDQGSVELLTESNVSPAIEFVQSGSAWFFSTNNINEPSLLRTDGTVEGTQFVPSAGSIHSTPVALGNGSVLTLYGEDFFVRNFQVTNPETLETTKLDFILPNGSGLTRELYGSIVVGVDAFFYVEGTGSNARRLMMADTRARTVLTVFEGRPNEAIGAPVLRGENMFFTHVTPTRSDLIQFNIVGKTSVILASVATDGWQGLTIDKVDEDSLIGFMQTADNASIFKLHFADSKLDTVSLVDDAISISDLYSKVISDQQFGPFWKLDAKTIAFSTKLEINSQAALVQEFAYDTSVSGLTKLISPSLPQPSRLRSGAIYVYEEQPVFRAGGKIVYHSGYESRRSDGTVWHEIWSTGDGQSAQKMFEVKDTFVNGNGTLIPLGVVEDRFYFLATGPTTTLYRTNEDATAVEVVTDTQWGGQMFFFNNFELMYRPSLQDDPQRILFRRMGEARDPGIWEIAGTPPVLRKIIEPPAYGTCVAFNSSTCSVLLSAGALTFGATESRGPLVEVAPNEGASDRIISFFGEDSSLALAEQKKVTLYRLEGAWVGVVPGQGKNYSFWSRPDDSSNATQVSNIDLSQFEVNSLSVGLLEFAVTTKAVVFVAHTKMIRLDRDGTNSVIDLPPLQNSLEFYSAVSLLGTQLNRVDTGLSGLAFLRAGGSTYTSHIYALNADTRSLREVNIAGDKHGIVLEEIEANGRQYVLTDRWPNLTPTKITRELQNVEPIELAINQTEATLSLAVNRVIVQSTSGTLYNSAAQALSSLSLRSVQPDAIITVDVGSLTTSSRFPPGGVLLSLAQRSTVRLVGTAQSPVTYELDDDVLTISTGGLAIRLINPRDVTIEDQIVALDRNWNFSTGNDDIKIAPTDTGGTEFVERVRKVAIRVLSPAVAEGESPNATVSHWRINTKTGDDNIAIDPNVAAIAILSIVSDLDKNSLLKLNLPAVSGPLNVTHQNGRTFANVSVAGLQVQLDNTRRPKHNFARPNDADNSGSVTALDALRIINAIARQRRGGQSNAGVAFGDTNGDGRVSSLDALYVINYIARQIRNGQSFAEGEETRKRMSKVSEVLDAM